MRKKLLALLMCATMVLGTGVTAMAATTVKEAEKIGGENAANFMLEYWKADEAITSVTSNGTNGTVTYGYSTVKDGDVYGTYTPVVVYKNSKSATGYTAATKLSAVYADQTAYELKAAPAADGTKTVKDVVPSLTTVKVQVGGTGDKVDKTADYVIQSNDKVYDSKGNLVFTEGTPLVANTSILAANFASAAYNSAVTGKYAVYVQTIGGSKDLYLVDLDATTVEKTAAVEGTKKYVATPANNDADKLVVAKKNGIIKSTDENSFGTIWSTVKAAGKFTDVYNIQAAIDNKTFTKDAVAVQVLAYVQAPIATDNRLDLEESDSDLKGLAKTLFDSTKIQGGQFTFDSDLISRTAFKDAAAVDVFTLSLGRALDENYGLVTPFDKLATVAVDKTIVFDKSMSYGDGVFVFDKGELAAEPETNANDGVADKDATTTTPAADNTASPKTGDVAPIAALAVVMMGAFGAMVVASKKRA